MDAAPRRMAALDALPNELLSVIVALLQRPQDLVSLALCNRTLHRYVELDGWKALLKGRWGLAQHDAASFVHGLSTLQRNWTRKAFVARFLTPGPADAQWTAESRRAQRPTSQTMGYQPSIDSYGSIFESWQDRREVLAWSAGAKLMVRIAESGNRFAKSHGVRENSAKDVHWAFTSQANLSECWYRHQIPNGHDGIDDITALKLLRPHQKSNELVQVVYGTASGKMSLLTADPTTQLTLSNDLDSSHRSVDSITVSDTSEPLLAMVLGNTTLALAPLADAASRGHPWKPISEVKPDIPGLYKGRIWSCAFLSPDMVALGVGKTTEPIQIYRVTPSGLSPDPYRTFSMQLDHDLCIRLETDSHPVTSVYPIAPLPLDWVGTPSNHVFLSGAYDGLVRLHDTRSARSFESVFWDVTNDSPVYSLACQGPDRILIGSSMHSMLKVFDVRMSGARSMRCRGVSPTTLSSQENSVDMTEPPSVITGGWNLFLNPRASRIDSAVGRQFSRSGSSRNADSPVYSLSIPSPTSPTLYAGLEGTIASLAFHSVPDKHPDLSLGHDIALQSRGHILQLGMYQQGHQPSGAAMQLLVQDSLNPNAFDGSRQMESSSTLDYCKENLDIRWKNPRNDLDAKGRWGRVEEASNSQADAGQLSNGHRGRRRGRGRGRTGYRGSA